MIGSRNNSPMSAREEILNQLHSQAREVTPPSPWRSQRQFADPAGQFGKALTAVAGEVHSARTREEALNHLSELLREIKAQSALIDDHPVLAGLEPLSRWPDIDWYVVGHSTGDLRQFAAAADVGISGADAALAETGTVVVSSGPGRSRLTSLMPPVHIALVPASCLTGDLFTWMAEQKPPLPASVTLISGPSKTADIEQTMAVGVHGPGRFIAVLYQD
jgi:L-lactate dehydrogenase complex protein LldG